MKLSSKFNIIHIVYSIVLFTIFSVFYYQFTNAILNKQINNDLYAQKAAITNYLRNADSLPNKFPDTDDDIQIEPYPQVIKSVLNDTMAMLKNDTIKKRFRQLVFTYKKKEVRCKITISKELYNTDQLKNEIIIFELFALLILIIILYSLNFFATRQIMKPLTQLSDKFVDFDIKSNTEFEPIQTSTSEFQSMQTTFKAMLTTIKADFENLKLFTENASHEMQTPLTIIKNSVELLIQKPGYDEAQIKLIQNISNNSNKLRKIHNDLLWLSKLEGNYFENNIELDYNIILNEVLLNYDLLRESKGLTIIKNNVSSCIKISNKEVAYLLFNNLVSNAIKHSYENSTIEIALNEFQFIISNIGKPPLTKDHTKIFERFYKEHKQTESTGLGLAMVKQICINMKYTVEYKNEGDKHVFELHFSER